MMNLSQYKLNDYLQYVFGLILLVALIVGGYFGYGFYKNRLDQAAQVDLSKLMGLYQEAIDNVDAEQIKDLEKSFQVSAEKNKDSKLYPYFLAYQADALIWQNKAKEAAEVLGKSVRILGNIDKTNPLYYLYADKLAKLKLDIPEFSKEAKEELEKLNQDKQNPFRS